MRVLAVMGSYRKGQSTDKLVEAAIEGASLGAHVEVDKLVLVDQDIQYCRNCMACRRDEEAAPYARCVIHDGMADIYPRVAAADAYIFGTPVNIGAVTAITKTFLERLCWTFAKPGRWPLAGCPKPRATVPKQAVILVSAGIVPPLLRRSCDDATPLIKCLCRDSLNARVLGTLYAGAVDQRGVERYLARARELGRRLTA